MKTLLTLILLLPVSVFAQRDLPPEYSGVNPSHPKAIFKRDTTSTLIYQVMLRNDTASKSDSGKFYEIVHGYSVDTANHSSYNDTMLLRFKNSKTGVEDTVVNKTGVAQDYEFTKPIVGEVMFKLLSPTSVDIWVRKRKSY